MRTDTDDGNVLFGAVVGVALELIVGAVLFVLLWVTLAIL